MASEGQDYDYVLRISTNEYERRVFENCCYYVGVRRRFGHGTTIFLARGKEGGDSFIGYGTVQMVRSSEEYSREETRKYGRRGWKRKLIFGRLVRFDPPFLIEETVLKGVRKGRVLHGKRLTPEQVESVLDKAKERCKLEVVCG